MSNKKQVRDPFSINKKQDKEESKEKKVKETKALEETEERTEDFKAFLTSEVEGKRKKTTIEDTHTRLTFLLENELYDEFNEIAQREGRGFKTHVLNAAVRKIVEAYKE
ncbi:hypothetical protein [Alkalibacillus aidingensis]|uniref:hypothetical protein n=1 Tax=Alkalibacillus aidingensis TaxID=2747607 RepID=UPI001660E5A0|nr:hypothetical protein [Alkalibacillus aidingensis]